MVEKQAGYSSMKYVFIDLDSILEIPCITAARFVKNGESLAGNSNNPRQWFSQRYLLMPMTVTPLEFSGCRICARTILINLSEPARCFFDGVTYE